MLGIQINVSFSQEFEEIIYSISSVTQQEYTTEQLEELQEQFLHPLNLNAISEEDCNAFIFLSSFEQKSLWDFISKNKPLQSIYEIQLVLGLPLEKAQLLSKFCIVEPTKKIITLQDLLTKGSHTFALSNSSECISFLKYSTENPYEGNPIKQVFRYRYHAYNSVYWGFTCKKDPGEAISFKNSPLYDFQSLYFQIKNIGTFSNIVAGNYKLQIGQGLIVWQGGFYGKSLEQINSNSLCSISKQSSSNEYGYLQGVASTFTFSKFTITPFISSVKIDGKSKSDSINFPFQLYETGYHRTNTEIKYKQAIQHTLFGIHTQYSFHKLKLGLTYVQQLFIDDSIHHTMKNMSFSYAYKNKTTTLFGETALDRNLNIATINGLQYNLNSDVLFTGIFRNYSPSYQSFMSKAFSEQTVVQNEIGLYSRIDCILMQFVRFQCSHDIFYMPHNRYFVYASTHGTESSSKLEYKTFSGFSASYQYSFESKTEAVFETAIKETIEQTKQFHKIKCSIPIHPKLRIQMGLLLSNVSKNSISKGVLLFQDLQYKPTEKLTITIRYAQFDAPYEARIYAWEDNVLYSFSSSQYYYAGTQLYGIIKYKITPKFQIQSKISSTQYSHTYELPESYNAYSNKNKIVGNVIVVWEL